MEVVQSSENCADSCTPFVLLK